MQRLFYVRDFLGKLTDEADAQIRENIVENYRQIEATLKKASPKQRARMIAQNELDGKFDEDGSLRADFLRSLGESVTDGQADTQGENGAQGASVGVVEGKTDFSLRIKYSDGKVEELADARGLTNEQTVEYLNKAKSGELKGRSYIPVRSETPQVLIDTLEQVNEHIENRSLVMQVNKARNAMSTENLGTQTDKHGNNVRKHGLSPEQIVEVMDNLDNPSTVIYQTNRHGKNGEALPNSVAVFVAYNNNGQEDVAVIEFENPRDPDAIGYEFGETEYHTVVTVFEPDVERDGMPFDYAQELLANPDNVELTIDRRHSAGSATREIHPNASSKMPSGNSIPQNADLSTDSAEKSSGNFDHRYMSPDLWHREGEVDADLQAISKRSGTQAKVFSDELSEGAKKNYRKTKKALNALNAAGGNGVSLVITEPSDTYKGGLVDGRTIYMPADQLENGDWAGTLVHEFTHFEEGTKEYSEMMDYLQSDDILVDDGKGGRATLRDVAEQTVQGKGYGFDTEALRTIVDKADAGEQLTAEEAQALRAYTSEVTAHETEIMLGNEGFIDRIVRQNGSAADRLVGKLLSLDKAFSKMGDKQAKAQRDKIREAERLYLKAATAAGNANIRKMILSQVPELEDEETLTSMNEENMQVSVQYNLNENAASELHKALYDTSYRDEVLLRDVTPGIMMSQKGVRNLPMAMNASHIRENVFSEDEAKKLGLRVDDHTHYHGLGEGFFLKIIDGLDNVTEAYRGTKNAQDTSRRENYFLLVSEFKDKQGNTINVPVYIEERAKVNRVFIDTNKISTVFGRDGFRDYISRQVRDKNLVRIKDRSTQASESPALIAGVYGLDASDNSIAQNSEKSTENAKKVSDGKTVQLSLKEDANQQTSDDFSELFASAGIEGEAAEIRGDLAELYRVAEDQLKNEKGKKYVDRVANRIAMEMARKGKPRDGETEEAMAERLYKEILASVKQSEPIKSDGVDTKQQVENEPKPKKTGYTYDDVNTMLDDIRKSSLEFETAGGVIKGQLFRNDRWDLGKCVYNVLKEGELGSKRELAKKIASLIVDTVKVNEKGADGKTVGKRYIANIERAQMIALLDKMHPSW